MSDLQPAGVTLIAEGADQFEGALGGAATATEAFNGAAESASSGIGAFGTIVTGALLEVGMVAVDALGNAAQAAISFFSDGFADAMEAESVLARVNVLLEGTGHAAGMTIDDVQALGNQFAHLAGGSDDAVIAIEEMALRMGSVSSDEMPGFIQTTLDLAAATGTDAVNAARLLAQAQEDPLSTLTRWRKMGIQFDDDLKGQIKTLQDSGDTAGAYALVMQRVADVTGGAAAAQAETLSGRIEALKGRFGEAAEGLMGAFIPALETLFTNVIEPAIPVVEEIAAQVGMFFSALLGGGDAFDVAYEGFDILTNAAPELSGVVHAVQDAFAAVYDFVVSNWPLIQSTAQTVFDAVGEVMDSVGGLITGTIIPAFKTIWGQTSANLPTVQQVFESVMAAVSAAVTGAAQFVTTVLVPAITAAVEWVVANWPAIQATFETVFNAARSIVETVLPIIFSIISSVLSAVQTFWAANGASIMANVQTTFETVRSVISTVLTAASAIIQAVLSGVQAFWAAHGASIMQIVTTMFQNAYNSISTVLNVIGSVIRGVLSGIQSFWDTWGGAIMHIVDNVVDTIGAVIDGFAAALRGDWTAVGESLRTIWNNAWDNVKTIVSTAVSAISNTDWAGIGTAIINGIASGISAAAGFLQDAARNAAQAALDAAKGFLGIHSPSKVAADQIGKPFIQGIAKSMTDGADVIVRASKEVAISMIPSRGMVMGAAAGAASINNSRSAAIQFGDVNISNGMDAAHFDARVRQIVSEVLN